MHEQFETLTQNWRNYVKGWQMKEDKEHAICEG